MKEKETKGNEKNSVASSLQSVLKKKTFIYSKISMKYLDTSNKNKYHNVQETATETAIMITQVVANQILTISKTFIICFNTFKQATST